LAIEEGEAVRGGLARGLSEGQVHRVDYP
jgi:hypothetical protein